MYSLIKNFLFQFDPEIAHNIVKSTKLISPNFLLKTHYQVSHSTIEAKLGDTELLNPMGLAAGFDKNAEMIPFMEALGFGFLEIGSITSKVALGNSKPRIFRLIDDQSIINRMGLPNLGADRIAENLSKIKSKIPLGINIAKTPKESKSQSDSIKDYIYSLEKVGDFGSYLAINLSCPNTGDGKTFEDPTLFSELASELKTVIINKKIKKPVLIKLSPDTDEKNLAELVDISMKYNFDGFIMSNTTISRENLKTSKSKIDDIGRGGLSGRALIERSNHSLKYIRKIVGPDKLIIGVGGIMDFKSLLSKLRSGADLVQVYTGLIYQGPGFIKSLNQQLIKYCQSRGYTHYSQIKTESSL